VQVAGECFRHLDTLGPDERKGEPGRVTATTAPATCLRAGREGWARVEPGLLIGERVYWRIGRLFHPGRFRRLARTATSPLLVVPRAGSPLGRADLTTSPAILAAHARIAAEDR
jgi:hypothetical protein